MDFTATMWACGFMVAFVSSIFTAFWKIIANMEDRLNKKIDGYVTDKNVAEKENTEQHNMIQQKHDTLYEKSHTYMTLRDALDTFAKKEVVEIQFHAIKNILAQLNLKMDDLMRKRDKEND